MVIDLQGAAETLDQAISKSQIRLLKTSAGHLKQGPEREITEEESEGEDSDSGQSTDENDSQTSGDDSDFSEDEDEDEHPTIGDGTGRSTLRTERRSVTGLDRSETEDGVAYAETDSELDSELDDEANERVFTKPDAEMAWKAHLRDKAAETFERYTGNRRQKDWMRLIYNSTLDPSTLSRAETSLSLGAARNEEEEEELLHIKKDDSTDEDAQDQSKISEDKEEYQSMLGFLRQLFITGDDDANDGDGGEESPATLSLNAVEDGEDDVADARASNALAMKKSILKRKFDAEYDDPSTSALDFYDEKKDEMAQQQQLNRVEMEGIDPEAKALVEGFRPGSYVRLVFENAPCELVENFDPLYPIIVGGLLPAEERFGFIQTRVKRHRWFTRTLKTNDPLIISMGWRRFQTTPIYALDDHSIRMRMLKYTPEHMHCFATFYGPVAVPNTGFCAFNTLSAESTGFRVSATGVVLDIDRSTTIVKKIKLTGVPFKVYKNTAFVKDMFTSPFEVAKFEGATIKTVSGLRGQIKKALAKPEGAFRATFEDKVLAGGM